MNDTSINKIKIDFEKSKNSFLFDENTNESYLDFMGMYSTLAVGYNSDIIYKNVDSDLVNKLFANKITNCEINSDVLIDFENTFIKNFNSNKLFDKSYFCSSGAMAIEAAIKCAFYCSDYESPKVLTFKGSFHGIYGYGRSVTDRFDSTIKRLNFLENEFGIIEIPFYANNSNELNSHEMSDLVEIVNERVSNKNNQIAAILVEPIQCTFGDYYIDTNFLKEVKKIASENNIPLIFDEIQTGFYTTGRKWYYEHIGVVPDILVFGKKTQVSGILVSNKFSTIFNTPGSLEITWDSNLLDMYRSTLIMKELSKKDIEVEIQKKSHEFVSELSKFKNIKRVRSCGYLIAIELESHEIRDNFVRNLKKNKMICNPTRSNIVRFRPHLLASKNDFDKALEIINVSLL